MFDFRKSFNDVNFIHKSYEEEIAEQTKMTTTLINQIFFEVLFFFKKNIIVELHLINWL